MQRPIDNMLKELERVKKEIETYQLHCKHENLSKSQLVFAITGSSRMANTCLNCDKLIFNNDLVVMPTYTLNTDNSQVFPLDDYYKNGTL